MVVRQKPDPKVVKKSAKELANKRYGKLQREEDARILDDQKNAPKPHKRKRP